MLIQELMTRTPITTTPEIPVTEALSLMREKKVRRLPVLDKSGKLIGIVSDKDLLYASPSSATSLSVFEINSLISKITVQSVMTKKVITITEDLPVEEAARIMADNKIGGLPVMSGSKLVGIVTETDIFRALLQFMGARRPGIRVRVHTPGVKGSLAKVTRIISEAGGDLVGVAVNEASNSMWYMTFKVQDITKDALAAALEKAGVEIMDIRETKGSGY